MKDLTTPALTAEQIETVGRAAGRAPSVHNTQPWRITMRRGDLYLSSDADRRLAAADPQGREMVMSCGAALYNLVLALRHLGHRPAVQLLPDADYPHQLAAVSPDGGPGPADGDEDRFAAIALRRTYRGVFTADPVPDELLRLLQRAAVHERAELTTYDGADVRALATVTELASYMHARDGVYAAEHNRWMRAANTARADGIHAAHVPGAAPRGDPHFPPRFVDETRPPTTVTPPTGVVALLSTRGDTPRDWLHAGLALQRVLLQLTAAGYAAALHSQPLEIPHLRDFVAGEFTPGRHPQMLLRIGHPEPVSEPAPPAPRRPITEILR